MVCKTDWTVHEGEFSKWLLSMAAMFQSTGAGGTTVWLDCQFFLTPSVYFPRANSGLIQPAGLFLSSYTHTQLIECTCFLLTVTFPQNIIEANLF